MRNKLDLELDKLNKSIIEMGMLVESAIACAITSLKNKDREMAFSVAEIEMRSNEMERDIEASAIRLLLSQQPVAKDLRMVSAALKIITDMERIGDQAQDIAEIAMKLMEDDYGVDAYKISTMAKETVFMVNNAVESYVNQNAELAHKVIESDDIVDDLFVEVRDALIAAIGNNKSIGAQAIDFIMIAKYLERIGDHAVNIAERVLYMITGRMD